MVCNNHQCMLLRANSDQCRAQHIICREIEGLLHKGVRFSGCYIPELPGGRIQCVLPGGIIIGRPAYHCSQRFMAVYDIAQGCFHAVAVKTAFHVDHRRNVIMKAAFQPVYQPQSFLAEGEGDLFPLRYALQFMLLRSAARRVVDFQVLQQGVLIISECVQEIIVYIFILIHFNHQLIILQQDLYTERCCPFQQCFYICCSGGFHIHLFRGLLLYNAIRLRFLDSPAAFISSANAASASMVGSSKKVLTGISTWRVSNTAAAKRITISECMPSSKRLTLIPIWLVLSNC